MKKYLLAYGLWLTGVLTAAAAAWLLYTRRVLPLGEEELAAWYDANGGPPSGSLRPAVPSPAAPEAPGSPGDPLDVYGPPTEE